MKMNKKAEGLTLNTIVVAVLVLLVLIVLIMIFTGKLSLFNRGANECPPESVNSQPQLDSCQYGPPLKVVEGTKEPNKGKLMYCCPKPENS